MDRVLAEVRTAFAGWPEAARFLADWPKVTELRRCAASALPVCRWLAAMRGGPGTQAVLTEVQRLAGSLAWRQTYGAADFGGAFLQGYGWSEFIGLRGPVASQRIACGVLL